MGLCDSVTNLRPLPLLSGHLACFCPDISSIWAECKVTLIMQFFSPKKGEGQEVPLSCLLMFLQDLSREL